MDDSHDRTKCPGCSEKVSTFVTICEGDCATRTSLPCKCESYLDVIKCQSFDRHRDHSRCFISGHDTRCSTKNMEKEIVMKTSEGSKSAGAVPLCFGCSGRVESMAECDNNCGTTIYYPCKCEVYRADGKIVHGHNDVCGIDSDEEMRPKVSNPHKIFVTKGTKSSPTEKNVKEEFEELRADREALIAARRNIESLQLQLKEEKDERNKDQIRIRDLEAKLKNIKRSVKLLRGYL